MASLLRPTSTPALNALLASGAPTWRADLFALILANGTTYYWTSYDQPITVGGATYLAQTANGKPLINRSGWSVGNTMAVPVMQVTLRALNAGFAGGPNIKAQINQGLLDGAFLTLTYVFGPATSPGQVVGTVGIFGGVIGQAQVTGTTAVLTVKGKNNLLDQYIPRNLYQIGCNHSFCDAGCTLSAATFTHACVVASGVPTPLFLPWSSPPVAAGKFIMGQVTILTGAAAGQQRTIAAAAAGGLTLDYPLYVVPALGDTFSAFEGCSKALDDVSGQSCTDRANTQHYRGFPYVPPPSSAY
jgi:hypothetical protein